MLLRLMNSPAQRKLNNGLKMFFEPFQYWLVAIQYYKESLLDLFTSLHLFLSALAPDNFRAAGSHEKGSQYNLISKRKKNRYLSRELNPGDQAKQSKATIYPLYHDLMGSSDTLFDNEVFLKRRTPNLWSYSDSNSLAHSKTALIYESTLIRITKLNIMLSMLTAYCWK